MNERERPFATVIDQFSGNTRGDSIDVLFADSLAGRHGGKLRVRRRVVGGATVGIDVELIDLRGEVEVTVDTDHLTQEVWDRIDQELHAADPSLDQEGEP